MFAADAVVFPLIVVLLTAGLRGRRTDDHPLCRRCGFDLTGRAARTTVCGECGADLSPARAIRIGHRVRRRGLIAGGAGLGMAAAVVLGGAAWAAARGVNLLAWAPVWWLQHELDGGPAAQAAALEELRLRVGPTTLTEPMWRPWPTGPWRCRPAWERGVRRGPRSSTTPTPSTAWTARGG